jgi:NADH dehydrogenase
VVGVDLEGRRVRLRHGGELPYDTLVVAPGARVTYPPGTDWPERAPGLKTIEDAIEIRRRVLLAFEAAERERHAGDAATRRAWLTFVIIGGGTTGVELAGVLAELAREILRHDFRHIDPARARIVVVQSQDRILPDFEPALSRSAARDLQRLRVRIVTESRVAAVDELGVTVRSKATGETERVDARTVLWAAGVRPSELGEALCAAAGVQPAEGGRVPVGPDLTLPGHPEVFVIGDVAAIRQDGTLLPGVAPVAMQAGRYVARAVGQRLEGRTPPPFRYRDKGLLATIGRGAAVAQLGPVRFDGFLAWVVWVFIHLLYLVGFQSRVIVLFRWTWDFFLHQRGARLITGPEVRRLPPGPPEAQAPAGVVPRPERATGVTFAARGAVRTRRERLRVGTLGRR